METTEQPEQEQPKPTCTNCGKKMSKKGTFCPHCGQKQLTGRIRMRDLALRFMHNLIHVDNKFVKICWHLLFPARVTIAFFEGKIKRYPHPVQFFFVVMFFFLLLLHKVMDRSAEWEEQHTDNSAKQGEVLINLTGSKINGQKIDIFESLREIDEMNRLNTAFRALPDSLRSPSHKTVFDTLTHALALSSDNPLIKNISLETDSSTQMEKEGILLDSLPFFMPGHRVAIAVSDVIRLEPEAIFEQYKIDNFWDKLLVKQALKTVKSPQGLQNAYLGSFSWTILALIAGMSVVLKILFRKRYYAEHFVFLLHQHSGIMLLLVFAMSLALLLPANPNWVFAFALVWGAVFTFMGMLRYYGQSGWRTFFKWAAYSVFYFCGFITCFISTVIIVFMVF